MDFDKLCPHCMMENTTKEGNCCAHCGREMKADSAPHQLKPFTVLQGKYLVGDVLGEGGFGITYIGLDMNLEVRVAIKEFYPNGYVTRDNTQTSTVTQFKNSASETVSKWKNGFVKEARALGKCQNLPGIVGVKDFFEENGTAYIVMDYVDGKTVKNYAKENGGKLDPDRFLYAIRPIMSSLQMVHDQGVIHRDISPDNIILMPGGNMKLIDFGAARSFTDAEANRSLSVMLKPGYAPEEQYRTHGDQGPWSDVYALAATIYKCLSGVTPVESMERMRNDPLKSLKELGIPVSDNVNAAIQKGMAVYAEDRYRSVKEFEEALYNGSAVQEAVTGPQGVSGSESVSVKNDTSTQKKASQAVGDEAVSANNVIQSLKANTHQYTAVVKDKAQIYFKDNKKRKYLAIAIGSAVFVAVILLILANRSTDAELPAKEEIIEEEEKTVQEASPQIDTEYEREKEIEQKTYEEFGISKDSVSNYSSSQVLDYGKYNRYVSNIENFNFSYPAALYNSVTVSENVTDNTYGDIIQQVSMSGSDGSTAYFSIQNNSISAYSLEAMTEYAYRTEKESMFAPESIVNGVSKSSDHGTVILIGYKNSSADSDHVYDLCRIESKYLYRMRLTYPRASGSEDDRHKSYFRQMMYCQCDYSGASSSKPMRYDQWVNRAYENFTLTESQKEVIWGLTKYMIYFDMPLGSKNTIANGLSDDYYLLQLYLYSLFETLDDDREIIMSDDVGVKEVCYGALDHARAFYRDMFGLELDTDIVAQDSPDFDPGDFTLLYNSDYRELVYAHRYGDLEIYSGPDELTYDEGQNCFVYRFGPVYYLTSERESWTVHRDRREPGYGIYELRFRPFYNSSIGFEFISLEREQ